MFKNMHALVVVSILYGILIPNGDSIVKIKKESEVYTVQNKLLITILQNCDLGLKNVGIYDNSNDTSTFDAISSLQPLFTSSLAIKIENNDKPKRHFSEFQAIIIAGKFPIRNNSFNDWKGFSKMICNDWKLSKNGSIFVMPKTENACSNADLNFLYFKRVYVFNVYYICLLDKRPIVYTYDLYGNSRSTFWEEISSDIDFGNRWTLYRRFFKQGEICKGLVLNQELLRENVNITIGISKSDMLKSSSLKDFKLYHKKDIIGKLSVDALCMLENLLKLLGFNAHYYIAQPSDQSLRNMSRDTSVDFTTFWCVRETNKPWTETIPVFYHDYTIVSHNQGYMEPIEKIRDYYGRWTLISIIIILTVTFIVIWLKNKKISAAVFDVLRLLINGCIMVPIDTLPLKIFFIMIFLYFLVIQATFSGHLAEFLTKPQLRKNIDSIEDLQNPRIKTIYNLGYLFDDDNHQNLVNKTTKKTGAVKCLFHMKKNKHSACFGTITTSLAFMYMYSNYSEYYMSKKKFATAPIIFPLRKRFHSDEQLTWAFLYLLDTKNSFHEVLEQQRFFISMIDKREFDQHINFRPIKLKDLQFAFIMLGIGNCLGCVCFFFEILIVKCKSTAVDTLQIKHFSFRTVTRKLRRLRRS